MKQDFTHRLVEEDFNRYNKKYMCSTGWRKVHCTIGGRNIAIFFLFMLIINLVFCIFYLPGSLIQVPSLVIEAFIALLFIHGLKRSNNCMICPFVVLASVGVVCLSLGIVILIIGVLIPYKWVIEAVNEHSEIRQLKLWKLMENDQYILWIRICFLFLALLFTFWLIMSIWSLSICLKCFKYIKDFNYHRRHYGLNAVTFHS